MNVKLRGAHRGPRKEEGQRRTLIGLAIAHARQIPLQPDRITVPVQDDLDHLGRIRTQCIGARRLLRKVRAARQKHAVLRQRLFSPLQPRRRKLLLRADRRNRQRQEGQEQHTGRNTQSRPAVQALKPTDQPRSSSAPPQTHLPPATPASSSPPMPASPDRSRTAPSAHRPGSPSPVCTHRSAGGTAVQCTASSASRPSLHRVQQRACPAQSKMPESHSAPARNGPSGSNVRRPETGPAES